VLQFRAMNKALPILLTLFVGFPCAAQMSPSEHRDYMKRLDAATLKWQEQISALSIDNLNVSYSVGKNLEQTKEIAMQNLNMIRRRIKLQLRRDRLEDNIGINLELLDLSNMLHLIVQTLPATGQAERLGEEILTSSGDVATLEMALRKHVFAYAEAFKIKPMHVRGKRESPRNAREGSLLERFSLTYSYATALFGVERTYENYFWNSLCVDRHDTGCSCSAGGRDRSCAMAKGNRCLSTIQA